MKLCTILKIFALALAVSFSESSLAHGQISGTVTAPGFDPQSAELAPEKTADLAAAAETAIEHGDHRKAFAHYMSICTNAEAWACLRAAEILEDKPHLKPEPYIEIGLHQMACDLGGDKGCDRVRQAFQETDAACASNDAEACMANAMLRLHNFTEITYTPGTAAEYFGKACELGHAPACTELGYQYALGMGIDKDPAQATRLFERACTEANAIDCNRIAEAYLHGRPVAMDVQRAADYFEQGCEYGDVFSCQKLGYAYLTGTFVDVDVDRARMLLQRACDAGATASCEDIPPPG